MTEVLNPSPLLRTDALPQIACRSTVYGLFAATALRCPDRIAIAEADGGRRTLTYAQLLLRVDRLARAMATRGVTSGSMVALLSENRAEYLELLLAAAKLGACVACQNWRLTVPELSHCLELVQPIWVFVSPQHEDKLATLKLGNTITVFGTAYETLLDSAPQAVLSEHLRPEAVDPESPLLILYTSGTTGLPKGAVLSHRAEITRNLVVRAEFGVTEQDTFVAWSPMYHMGAADCSLGTVMTGGKVIALQRFDAPLLADLVERETLGWLLLMPGMVERLADELEARGIEPRGVKLCGVMADLVPPSQIARITSRLQAPFANTFGATETGCPPCSSDAIAIGVAPTRLSKTQSPFCEVRLVDANDRLVPDGSPGELCIRGATLFSGYYRADAVNREEFRGGWFHMGDVFVRNSDGTLDFVDRVKYLIKSGGENIYPAEIERVLLADADVAEASVVRRPDRRWGEVPVALVCTSSTDNDPSAMAVRTQRLLDTCRRQLAGYKQPKAVLWIAAEQFPRSASGKVQRQPLESRLEAGTLPILYPREN